MVRRKVHLNEVADIGTFINAASAQMFDIDLASGRYVIDAKSVMGLYSLDLSKDIDLIIHVDREEDCKAFLDRIQKILV